LLSRVKGIKGNSLTQTRWNNALNRPYRPTGGTLHIKLLTPDLQHPWVLIRAEPVIMPGPRDELTTPDSL
jgi:hypothetical protein